jgi:GT2 family glycosyltransferase
MYNKKVCIIILNWNGLDDTIECLESLKKLSYPDHHVLIVDNGSTGNDVSEIKARFADYVHIIENPKNYGFTVGNNMGIKYARTLFKPDYYLLLNNDTVVAPDFLDYLVKSTDSNTTTGMTVPKVYYYELPDHFQTVGVKHHMWTGQISPTGRGERDRGQFDQKREVNSVMGCCMLIKSEVIDIVGLLDEDYFCYREETDYCLRILKAGYKIFYVPESKIWHKTPVRKNLFSPKTGNKKSPFKAIYYLTRNNFLLMKKQATRLQYTIYILIFFIYELWFRLGVCLFYYADAKSAIYLFRGAKDGLMGRTGESV